MTLNERARVDLMIRHLAKQEGKTPAQIRRDMKESIDDAWDNQDKRGSAAAWLKYFPDGKKPTVEEFIVRLAEELK